METEADMAMEPDGMETETATEMEMEMEDVVVGPNAVMTDRQAASGQPGYVVAVEAPGASAGVSPEHAPANVDVIAEGSGDVVLAAPAG